MIGNRNLTAYWRFEDSLLDLSGNGFTLTNSGATAAAGKIGRAYSYDGGDSMTVGDDSKFDGLTYLTVAAWIYKTVDSNGYIVSKSDGTAAGKGWYLTTNNGWVTNPSADFGLMDADKKYYVKSLTIALDTWYHLCGVWDSTLSGTARIKLYVNGVDSGTVTTGPSGFTALHDNSLDIYIGDKSGGSGKFNGTIDEVMIYNVALGSSDVRRIMLGMHPLM